MDNNTMKWWKIKIRLNDNSHENFNHIYISANMVIQLSDYLLEIDGNNLYYPYKIESVTESNYFTKLFEEILNTYFKFEYNDLPTWEILEEFFPDTICDNTVNTPDVLERNVLRFSYKGKLFEYAPHADRFLKVNLIG